MDKAVEVEESVEDEGIPEEVVPSASGLNLDLRLLNNNNECSTYARSHLDERQEKTAESENI